jgi:anaerobic selenocysteine-containing dehydrogenase
MDPERFDEAKLILIWGSNPIVSNLHLWSRCQQAKRRGAKLVAIDPWRSQTAEKCHQHVRVLPGTDAALALGMMHVIIREERYDRDYVDRPTLGFAALKTRVGE